MCLWESSRHVDYGTKRSARNVTISPLIARSQNSVIDSIPASFHINTTTPATPVTGCRHLVSPPGGEGQKTKFQDRWPLGGQPQRCTHLKFQRAAENFTIISENLCKAAGVTSNLSSGFHLKSSVLRSLDRPLSELSKQNCSPESTDRTEVISDIDRFLPFYT